MAWQDRFQEGSFRGAPFFITESRSTFGRRNQINEYPGRDTPFGQDLGRKARAWSIQCEVVGPDYDLARDALIKAIEAAGPGTLIHPYLGTLSAVCDPSEVTESTAQGGMASFALQFFEAGAPVNPAATVDTQGAAKAAASAVQTAAAASAAKRLSIAGKAAFVLSSAQAMLAKAKGAVSGALAAVQPIADGLLSVQQQVQGLVTSGISLLESPLALVDEVFTAVGGIGNLATYADDALSQLGDLFTFGSDLAPVATTTPSRVAQAGNQLFLQQLVQASAAAAAVTVVAEIDFASYDDAVGVRDPLADQLDTLATALADAGDDDLAQAVDDLRLAMIADVTARGASLAKLYAYTPATTEPALVIAQRLYGDATRADEIVARNAIQHPGFVPGGLALEVLTDA